MLLAIDIGNTNITLGIFKMENAKVLKTPVKTWRLSTDKTRTPDEYGTNILDLFHYAMIDSTEVKAVAVANVVPVLRNTFEEMSKKYFKQKAFFVGEAAKLPIDVLYENPKEVGADRIANAVAAVEFFGYPAVVIDFGTATTFDCINNKGQYIGGVIIPGPVISAESLVKRTAKLPMVEIVKPAKTIGNSTVSSIQSGIYHGYVGQIKELLKKIKYELKGNVKVIATGGLASLVMSEIIEANVVVPELTLEGIRIVREKSR